jgi:glutamine synthetase adenylyltransferase
MPIVFCVKLNIVFKPINDQQTQMLPVDEFVRLRLAVSLGFADWSAFYQTLNFHRQKISNQFQDVIVARGEVKTATTLSECARLLWIDGAENTLAALGKMGFQDVERHNTLATITQ